MRYIPAVLTALLSLAAGAIAPTGVLAQTKCDITYIEKLKGLGFTPAQIVDLCRPGGGGMGAPSGTPSAPTHTMQGASPPVAKHAIAHPWDGEWVVEESQHIPYAGQIPMGLTDPLYFRIKIEGGRLHIEQGSCRNSYACAGGLSGGSLGAITYTPLEVVKVFALDGRTLKFAVRSTGSESLTEYEWTGLKEDKYGIPTADGSKSYIYNTGPQFAAKQLIKRRPPEKRSDAGAGGESRRADAPPPHATPATSDRQSPEQLRAYLTQLESENRDLERRIPEMERRADQCYADARRQAQDNISSARRAGLPGTGGVAAAAALGTCSGYRSQANDLAARKRANDGAMAILRRRIAETGRRG
ncbi:MAG: hypothetical protein R3D27_07565 [Hyphomicrobiaceae bacterium]